MVRTRILLFLTGLILVPTATYFVVLFARGYRPNLATKSISVTGILAAKSTPDAAQIFINGQFKGATNTNFTLPPGSYEVEIKKDTYSTWKKTLEIQPEEVARAYVTLFPTIPSLKAITTTGASQPVVSPDGSKVAFFSGSNIYTLDISDSPLGLLNRDSQLVYLAPTAPSNSKTTQVRQLYWSPDSRQILFSATPSATLIDLSNKNETQDLSAGPSTVLRQWQTITDAREKQKDQLLPETLQQILATTSAELTWAPKETKIFYTATASASIPDDLIRPLPGSSTQKQNRTLIPGQTYVYDLEEDRNFVIPCAIANTRWFATSEHLLCVEKNKVSIVDYDGLNFTTIYAGPLESNYAFSYPSAKQVLILANLSADPLSAANLFALDLK